jgi:hypothetical protein
MVLYKGTMKDGQEMYAVRLLHFYLPRTVSVLTGTQLFLCAQV